MKFFMLFMLVFSCVLAAAQEESVWNSLSYRVNILALEKAHEENLDQLSDEEFIEAIQAACNLVMHQDLRINGDRAVHIRTHAHILLKKKEIDLMQDELGKVARLWLHTLDGETKVVLDYLNENEEFRQTSHGKALYAFSSTDWRELDNLGKESISEHEALALLYAYYVSELGDHVEKQNHIFLSLPKFSAGILKYGAIGFDHSAPREMMLGAYESVQSLALSSTIDNERLQNACTHLFFELRGFPQRDKLTKNDIYRGLGATLNSSMVDNGAYILAAWNICRSFTVQENVPESIPELVPVHTLLARSAQQNVFSAFWDLLNFVYNKWGVPEAGYRIYNPLHESEQQDILTAFADDLVKSKRPKNSKEMWAKEVHRELAHPYGLTPGLLMNQSRTKGRSNIVKNAYKAASAHYRKNRRDHEMLYPFGIEMRAAVSLKLSKNLEELAVALKINPTNRFWVDYLYAMPGKIAPLGKMFEEMPWQLDIANTLAWNHRKKKQWAEALVIYQKILKIDPANSDAGRYIGRAYVETGEEEKAIMAMKAYTAASNAFNVMHVRRELAEIYEKRGDIDMAERYYVKSAAGWQHHCMLETARFFERQGRYSEARKYFDRCYDRYVSDYGLLNGKRMYICEAKTDEEMAVAIKKMREAFTQVKTNNSIWDLRYDVRFARQQAEIVEVLNGSYRDSDKHAKLGIIMAVECGLFAEAYKAAKAMQDMKVEPVWGFRRKFWLCVAGLLVQDESINIKKIFDEAFPYAGDDMNGMSLMNYLAGYADEEFILNQVEHSKEGALMLFDFAYVKLAKGDPAAFVKYMTEFRERSTEEFYKLAGQSALDWYDNLSLAQKEFWRRDQSEYFGRIQKGEGVPAMP